MERASPASWYPPCSKFLCSSSARIFFGRSAVMAKALGTTPEEEHRMGIHKLAKVRASFSKLQKASLTILEANTRPDRRVIYGHRTRRGHRMVRRLSATRFRAGREYRQSDRHFTCRSCYAHPLRSTRTLSS